jgi:hypothetical protein
MAFWVFGRDATTKQPRDPLYSEAETEDAARTLAVEAGMEVEFIDPAFQSLPAGRKDVTPGGGEALRSITLCERKPFLDVLLSPGGLLNLFLAPLTLGITLLVLAGFYFLATPRRVWLQGGRLFSDSLPPTGVEIGKVRLELVYQTLGRVPINHCLRIRYTDWEEEGVLILNPFFFGAKAIDRVFAALCWPAHAVERRAGGGAWPDEGGIR